MSDWNHSAQQNLKNSLQVDEDMPHDPKMHRYEGDIKSAIVDEIVAHIDELGLTTLSNEDIRDIVDRRVSSEIGEIVEFNNLVYSYHATKEDTTQAPDTDT